MKTLINGKYEKSVYSQKENYNNLNIIKIKYRKKELYKKYFRKLNRKENYINLKYLRNCTQMDNYIKFVIFKKNETQMEIVIN